MPMNTCPECGITRFIMWPQFWPYRRGESYYCCDDCMRTAEAKDSKLIKMVAHMRALSAKGRKGKMETKLSYEQKKKAVLIAIDGGDPLAFIKQCGSANPSKMWGHIRMIMKEKEPELYAKIPDLRARWTDKPKPTRTAVDPASSPAVVKVSGPLKIETPEAGKVTVVEIPEKKQELIYKIRAIDTGIGSWEYSEKYGWISFNTKDGKDEVVMTPEEWAQLLRDLPQVFRVLGVKRR